MRGIFKPIVPKHESTPLQNAGNVVEYPRSIRELAIEDAQDRGDVFSDPELEANHEAHINVITVTGQYVERLRQQELGPDVQRGIHERAA